MSYRDLGALTALALLLAAPAWAQAPAAASPDQAVMQMKAQSIKPIKPGLYMVVGNGGNATVRITPAGLIVVDTKNPGDASFTELMGQIHGITKEPVVYAIETHHHADHAGNAGRFEAAGAKVIAQENVLAHLKDPLPAGREAPAAPTITYKDRYTVRLGGDRAELYHVSNGHTDDDTVVYFPELKTVVLGDLYVTVTPLVQYSGGGSILGTRKAIAEALKLDFDTAIPGHGLEPVSKDKVHTYLVQLDAVIDRVRAAIKAGAPKDQILKTIKSDDIGWSLAAPQWSGPAQLDGLYAELSKAP